MKKKLYVFKAEYRQEITSPGMLGVNHLTLVATFEAGAEKDALRFVSATGGGPYYLWNGGGVDVEEAK